MTMKLRFTENWFNRAIGNKLAFCFWIVPWEHWSMCDNCKADRNLKTMTLPAADHTTFRKPARATLYKLQLTALQYRGN